MQLLSTFLKDLRLLVRDRGEMASLFLMPLAFIVPIALAFPVNGYNLNEDRKPILAVANYDQAAGEAGEHAQALLDSLAESYEVRTDHLPADVAQLEFGPTTCATTNPACGSTTRRATPSTASWWRASSPAARCASPSKTRCSLAWSSSKT